MSASKIERTVLVVTFSLKNTAMMTATIMG